MSEAAGRFRPRPVRFTGVGHHGGWSIKWYEITLDGEPVDPTVVQAARRLVDESLCASPAPETGRGAHRTAGSDNGLGFVVLHHGAESVWLLLDCWTGDIVSQQTWSADLTSPNDFKPVPAGGPTACVWELAVHSHERIAFIAHVLDPVDGPDPAGYLADVATTTGLERVDQDERRYRRLVESFTKAWTAGDIDGLMALTADDPGYRPSIQPYHGFEYRGRDAVRAGFQAVLAAEREVGHEVDGGPSGPPPATTSVGGAISRWSYPTVDESGEVTMVEGVDLWTFDGHRIATKDAYRKVVGRIRSEVA